MTDSFIHIPPTEPNRLMVIFPLYHQVSVKWFEAWMAMDKTHVTRTMGTDGVSLTLAMQQLVDEALQHDDWDRLCILEHDMICPPGAFNRIATYGEEHDIVGSLYFMHDAPHRPYVYLPNEEAGYLCSITARATKIALEQPALYEAGGVGFGLTSIARTVLEKWPDDVPMFVPDIPDSSHDLWFCWKAREFGWRVWVDSAVVCGHLTQTVIGPDDNQRYLDKDDPDDWGDMKPVKK